MTPRFCYAPSITRLTCKPCSLAMFKALLSDPQVQSVCDQIKLLDGADPEEMARLKRLLPIITPHAQSFTDSRRHADSAVPSGLTMLDVDHIDAPRDWFASLDQSLIAQLRIYFVAITPSGHGLRIIAERMLADLAQDQARLANALGFVQYDSCTKDLSRASFVMPMSYVLYINELGLEFDDDEAAARAADISSYQSAPAVVTPSVVANHEDASAASLPTTYRNLPYKDIISQLVSLLGGAPEYGERNTFYFTLVRYARYICNFNPELILAVLPDFGLSQSERRSVVASAVNRPRKSDMPDLISRAVALTQAELTPDTEGNTASANSVTDSVAVDNTVDLAILPPVLRLICQKLPNAFRPAMVIAALPVLGTLATRVRFRYLDHAIHSFSFMSCITAPAATGKSFIRTPIKLLLTPIDEQDAIERQHEQDYKDALRASKNSKNQPENPRACPRNNGINISVAKILQLLTYSEGKHLIGIGEEIDTLVKTERAGVWSQKSDIYRLGFDNALYGQSYMNDQSWSANVNVFYNLLLTGTPGGMYRFFKDVEDGLVTRFCFAQLPDMFATDIPDFQTYTEDEQQTVISYARYLDHAEGTITCPAVDDAIAAWLEQKRKLAIESDSRAIDTLRRRAAVIGFRAGYLAHLLSDADASIAQPSSTHNVSANDKREAAFAQWVAEYVFANQMALFGSQFEKVADDYLSSVKTKGKVRKLLQSLPDTFVKADLMALRAKNGQSTDVGYILTRWKQNGLISEVATNTYHKL